MVPPAPARPLATWDDRLALPDEQPLELVDGELVEKALPSFAHGNAQAGLSGALYGFRGGEGGPRGPGGWWIVTEVEVAYGAHEVFRHDLAGWRRARLPSAPSDRPVETRPDWVCEVLAPSDAATDTVKKLRTLHRCGVPYYWLLDPEARTLRALRFTDAGYLEIASATVGETLHAEPFEVLGLSIDELLGSG